MRASLLLISVLAGCGDNFAVEPDASSTPEVGPPTGLPLQTRIDLAVQRIQSDTCFAQTDGSGCTWADYTVGPASFDMEPSTGEAILIVDNFDAGVKPQLVRYRNRIRGLYHVQGDALIHQDAVVHLPKSLGDALVSLAGPDFVPSSALTAVGQAAAVYSKLGLVFLGHGGVIWGHLVELAPEQPLVTLELDGLFGIRPALCDGVTQPALDAAAMHYSKVAASLRAVIAQHNVRFINASFGDTVQTIATDWSRTCGTAVPSGETLRKLLHLYDPIYNTLFGSPGVVTAHASSNLGDPADFPFDQVTAAFANRVRVGFISSLDSGLDAQGRGTVHKAEQFPRDGDADVYVNWGCEAFVGCADPHYEMAGTYGLGAFAVSVMSSSYVTPLGLGRLINLRYANHAAEQMSNALIQTLKAELTPSVCGASGDQRCVYQDPILHHQLEVYRRAYR